MRLVTHLRDHLRKRSLLPPGTHVVVACSGGADSVALAHLLAELADELGLGGLTLAHLDHGLRPDSAKDAEFVAALAERLQLPLTTERRLVEARPDESPEEAARRVRYTFLLEAATGAGATVIATAHHRDDQAETVLYRICRGTGLDGLAAIRERRALIGGRGVELVRPLLPYPATALREYLTERGETWREDPTNEDGNVRARLRNAALPALTEALGADPRPALARLAGIAAQHAIERDLGPDVPSTLGARFVRRADEGVLILRGALELPLAARRALGVEALRTVRGLEGTPSAEDLDRLGALLGGDRSRTLAGIVVEESTEGWSVRPAGADARPGEAFDLRLPVPGHATVPAGYDVRELRARSVKADNAAFLERLSRSDGSLELVDADTLVGTLSVRSRRNGDRFQPLGAVKASRLTHYLQRRGVAAAQKDRTPLVEDDEGILWVVGHGVTERARVTEETTRIVILEVDRGARG